MIYDWPEDYIAHCDSMRKERLEEPRTHEYEEECDLCHSTTGPMLGFYWGDIRLQ